jgi:MoaA/NifB/PqqE/SkfB family radical SAM enzyme
VKLSGARRVVQLHPTRRCNLSCRHCYSESGPAARDELPWRTVRDLVADAAALGYDLLAISGGEPALYPHLGELLRAAKSAGLDTTVTTNGALLLPRRLDAVTEHLDLLVMSLDGPPAEHDLMRGRPGAFAALAGRLAGLRQRTVPFGFLFTLTQHNVHQLEWAAGFATEQGAQLLQIHPLEAVGAGRALSFAVPDSTECGFAMLEVARLQREYSGRLRLHLDLVPARLLAQQLADLAREPDEDGWVPVSPLVVEPDGCCVPFQYGFPRHLALGDLSEHRLAALAGRWAGRAQLRAHLATVARQLEEGGPGQVVNGYDLIAAAARSARDEPTGPAR